jgi:hypothetical protein
MAIVTAKKIAACQKRKAREDKLLASVSIFFKDRVLGPLPQDPRPLWMAFEEASNATDEAYVAFVAAGEDGAPEWEQDALWDTYQHRGAVMHDALDAYNEAMGEIKKDDAHGVRF